MKRERLALTATQQTALLLQIRAEQKQHYPRYTTPSVPRDHSQRKHFAVKEPNIKEVDEAVPLKHKKHFAQPTATSELQGKSHRQRKHFPQKQQDTLNLTQHVHNVRRKLYTETPDCSNFVERMR